MADLIYAANMSLDGWTEDATGAVNWAPPDEPVFTAITELMGRAGTYLYGRRMYQSMAVWESDPALAAVSDLAAAYAQTWQAAEKVVYSTTLTDVSTARTRLASRFDPDQVRALKAAASADLLVGGPHLAAQAMAAGLVDEVALFVWPIILGGRNPALRTENPVGLDLIDVHRFANAVVRLRYRVPSGS